MGRRPQPQPRLLPLRLPRVQRLSPERHRLGRLPPPEPTRFPSPHRPLPASPAPRLRRRPLRHLNAPAKLRLANVAPFWLVLPVGVRERGRLKPTTNGADAYS